MFPLATHPSLIVFGARKLHDHSVIFYPKFRCELNFIERFWCAANFYARENCGYNFEKLRETIPAALGSVSSASINRYYHHCMKLAGGETHRGMVTWNLDLESLSNRFWILLRL